MSITIMIALRAKRAQRENLHDMLFTIHITRDDRTKDTQRNRSQRKRLEKEINDWTN